MDRITIACLVEGHGEVRAVPVLLRRLAQELSIWNLDIPNPQRVNRNRLVQPDELTSQVRAMAQRVPGPGGVLVLLDADDDLPCQLAPDLLHHAQAARPDKKVAVVLANREFEAWFLAAATSLAGRRGLPESLEPPPGPEMIRNAKGWLSDNMVGTTYRETVDQVAVFDIKASRQNSPSFDKFCREVERLLGP